MLNQYSFTDLNAFVASLGVYGRFFLQPFGYPLAMPAVAAGANGSATFRLSANSDFLVTALYAGLGGFNGIGGTIQIVDNGAGENFFQAAVPLTSVCSINENGLYNTLPFPRIVGNSSSLTATLGNNSAFAFAASELYFEGVLIKQLASS